jgi:hypothetical protein
MTASVGSRRIVLPGVPGELASTRRWSMAIAALIAPWGFVVANASYTWATRNGGADSTGQETLALYAQYPGLVRFAVLAVMVGCLLIVPAVLAAMRLASRSWLTFVGGVLMIGGYISYFAINGTTSLELAMAEHGGPISDFAGAIDASESDAAFSWIFLLFVAGNLLGTVLFAAGLLRSRVLPAWAAVLILCWPASHVLGLSTGTELPEVVGGVLQAIGFAILATYILRPTKFLEPAFGGGAESE